MANIPPRAEGESDTVNIFIRLPGKDLVFLCGLIESYDDLGIIKTLDPADGLAVIMTSRRGEETVRGVLNSVAEEVGLEILGEEERWNALFREKIYGLA